MSTEFINAIITTQHRGVFFAQIPVTQDLKDKVFTGLKNCRMAIRWGTTKGVMQLADEGPQPEGRTSSKADIAVLQDVTAVFICSEKGAQAWLNYGA